MEMLIYKNSVSRKNCENHTWDMTVLKGRRPLVTKIDTTFFVENEVLNMFYLTIFSKKKNSISKITLKNNFWGYDHF